MEERISRLFFIALTVSLTFVLTQLAFSIVPSAQAATVCPYIYARFAL
jgi:hypothetical protein